MGGRYAQIERAREEDDDDTTGPWKKREPKKADWDAVITLGLKALKERSKDLQIAAWVTEAMIRRRGLTGLRDGLRLDPEHPGDILGDRPPRGRRDRTSRDGIYDFSTMKNGFRCSSEASPLTNVSGLGPYSFLKFNESREVENLLRKPPKEGEDLEEATLQGRRKDPGLGFRQGS